MSVKPDRHTRPTPGLSRAYEFPPVVRKDLATGMRLVVASVPRLPLITFLAVIDAGAGSDPSGREGLAQLVAKLLLEGTAEITGNELVVRFERLGATVEATADWDTTVLSMTVTSTHVAEAFALFAEVLRRPAFRPADVERLKAERSSEILQTRSEPRGLADEAFESALFEPTSRYAVPEGGTEASVAAITATDVATFYSSRFSPQRLTLIVAGDTTADVVAAMAAKRFAGWTGGAAPGVAISGAPARSSTAVHLVARGDAPQSELRIGHVGIPRLHPDYFDVVVMNAILGGLFNSRINMNLREQHAYSYAAFSAFVWRRVAGPFVVSSAVKTDVTGAAIREVLNEIDRIRADGVRADELSLATRYLDGVFPIRFETTAAVAGALANQIIYGLPGDYFETYRTRIRAVSMESVHAAARRHLHPDRLQTLVVGDPAAVAPQLESLGIGPILTDAGRKEPGR